MYDHHHYLVPEYFYHLRKKPELTSRHSPLHLFPFKTNGSITYIVVVTLLCFPNHTSQDLSSVHTELPYVLKGCNIPLFGQTMYLTSL